VITYRTPGQLAIGLECDQNRIVTAMIDTHVHHWDLARFRYPWLDDAAFDDLRDDYLPADYRADAVTGAVDGWIHIQAEVDHQLDPVAETAWVASLAEESSAAGLPGPLACVVYADLRAANVREVLSRHCGYPLTRGVRQEAWFDPASTRADIPREDLLSDPAWQEGYRVLAEFGLSFDLLVWPDQLPQAATIAADVPAVPVVLEHLGLPDPMSDKGLQTWRTGVTTLAQLPHACVKLSAFSGLGNPRDERAVLDVVSELLDLFGPQRCMVGSNFPVERLAGDFRSLYDLVLACLQGLSSQQRGDVLTGTARRLYRISPPDSADDPK
jgi:predicted TIM-barrel fold metal-dependent hydrolase